MDDTTPQSHPSSVLPEPVVHKKTRYVKYKRPGDKTSWNKRYRPTVKELKGQVKQHYVDKHTRRGAAVGGSKGSIIGGLTGAAMGALVPGGLKGTAMFSGGAVGAAVGSAWGGSRGAKKGAAYGTKRGTRIIRMIPNKPRKVTKLQKAEPRAAQRFFASKKNLKKHRRRIYHKDYQTKTTATTTQVVQSPGHNPRIDISRDTYRGTRRKTAPTKTGFAKHGYYREDVIEALVEEMGRHEKAAREKIARRRAASAAKKFVASRAERARKHVVMGGHGSRPSSEDMKRRREQYAGAYKKYRMRNSRVD